MRTLKVQGKGEVTVTPDQCSYSLRICKKNSDYSSCYSELHNDSEKLRDILVKNGIAADEIKTNDFSVRGVTKYSRKLDTVLPDGYEGIHALKVKTAFNKELMRTVLNAITADCINDLSIKISFGVSDTTVIRKQLMRNSVASAKNNAETISDAAGITLGQIISIEYGRNAERFESHDELDLPTFIRNKEDDIVLSIVPADISTTDTVTVVYEIL